MLTIADNNTSVGRTSGNAPISRPNRKSRHGRHDSAVTSSSVVDTARRLQMSAALRLEFHGSAHTSPIALLPNAVMPNSTAARIGFTPDCRANDTKAK